MAKENFNLLTGFVDAHPLIMHDKDKCKAVFSIHVRIPSRNDGSGNNKSNFTSIECTTMDHNLVQQMINHDLQVYDKVQILGTLVSHKLNKEFRCKNCGRVYTKKTIIYAVNVIHIKFDGHSENEREAREYVALNSEFSNITKIIGTLVKNPERIIVKSKITKGLEYPLVRYPIAVGRKYTIRSDDPRHKYDYPWVYIYGEKRQNDDMSYLMNGSVVFIDGYLKSKLVDDSFKCGQKFENGYPVKKNKFETDTNGNILGCQQTIEGNGEVIINLIPFAVEYLENVRTKEEVQKIRSEEAKRIHETIIKREQESYKSRLLGSKD